MLHPTSNKVSKHHLKCVICDKTFGSIYDEELKAFPIYHPLLSYPSMNCEKSFFRILMGIYKMLLSSEFSVPAANLIKDATSLEPISFKKEYITWCLARGFLTVDQLYRIDIPHPIEEALHDIFQGPMLEDFDQRDGAADWIQQKLHLLHASLIPVSSAEMPFKPAELKLGDSTLFDKIDTSKVELRRDRQKDSESDSSRVSHLRSLLDRRPRS